jgi:uncharacterized OB-fold protein
MANVANCKKCGTLFLKTSRDICDKCFEAQNKMVSEINSFVILSQDETISLDSILEKYNLSRSEFEELFNAGKFVRIAKKVTIVCTKCGNVTPIENKKGTLCSVCAKKIQSEL